MYKLSAKKLLCALDAAIDAAAQQGINIVVTIVDAAGNVSASINMPGSFLASNDYAYWKAWTVASFKMSTKDFAAMLQNLDLTIREGLLVHDKVTTLPGGLPIFAKNGVLLGAIGVSGGTESQDEMCAVAASHAFAILDEDNSVLN